MPYARSFAAVLVGFLLSACGGKSFDAGEAPNGGTDAGGTGTGGTAGVAGTETGGTETGGTETGGTGTGGTATGGTGTGGTATGGTGVGGSDPECTRYYDEAPVSVPVMITNDTSAPIHLGPAMQVCDTVPLFTVVDAKGESLPEPGWCRSSCQSLHQQGGVGCPAICPIWETISLASGESMMTSWSGQYLTDGTLPSACVPFDSGGSAVMCDQAKTIRPGTFKFRAQAGTELECSLSSMCPPCTSGAQGGCKTLGTVIGGKLREATAVVQLDARYGVFEKPAPGDGNGAAPAPQPVHLIFSE